MEVDLIQIRGNQVHVIFEEERKNARITLNYEIDEEKRKLRLMPGKNTAGITRNSHEIFSSEAESEYQEVERKAKGALLADSRFHDYIVV